MGIGDENMKKTLREVEAELGASSSKVTATDQIEKAKQSRYIETFYSTVRIHSHCGYLSPNEYEEQYLKNLETDVTNLAS